MERVKRTMGVCGIFLAASLMLAGAVGAQPSGGRGGQPPSPPSASDLVSRMKQALNLTDEQVSEVTAIIQEEISQMQSLMQSGNPESGRSQMESIRQSTESKLANVLTAEQLAQWKSSMSKGPQAQGNGGSRPSGEGPSSSGMSKSTGTSGIF